MRGGGEGEGEGGERRCSLHYPNKTLNGVYVSVCVCVRAVHTFVIYNVGYVS